ncbi:MAG TPA: pyruvate kinase [Chloroflexi bacterium]|nr:pyruvate kinase [Chloroflexota bacterium]HHW86135.1 pyruvate kinase [Chloroflexota bacterium]
MLRVKIVCTIGPASRELPILRRIAAAGMNVARLNMSHGTHEYHAETIERIRIVSEQLQKPIAILADLQGPKLRTGKMREGGVPLVKDEELILTTDDIIGEPGRVPIQYKDLPKAVKPGERILLDDGMLELEVIETSATEIRTRVVLTGVLQSNKGMNLPDASLDIPALTPKDIEDVKFALDHQVDWVALSFVRKAHEVLELKAIIQNHAAFGRVTPVIAKIEKPDAVKNIDAIIEAADGIMVARGDLGIETNPETVPGVQKVLINKCLMAAKPVITATQMLDSMIRNPRPTRAEASDVANAVLDGTDAIMLSGETASGQFPVEAVATMAKIAEEAERLRVSLGQKIKYSEPRVFSASGAICHAAVYTAAETKAKAIIAPTVSGATAKLMASFRPEVPLIAVTPSPMVQRQLALYWGTYPLLTKRLSNTDEVVTDAINLAHAKGYIGEGDTVVLTAGVVGNVRSATNLMMVRRIDRVLVRGTGIGGREVAGTLMTIKPPIQNPEEIIVGPQHIIFAERIDRSCINLLRRSGGLVTTQGGMDSPGAVAAIELGIPAIIGAEGNLNELVDGIHVILDANTGQLSEWSK